ncbi:Uncharacterized protein DAT39_009234, partial [Clarias magur]
LSETKPTPHCRLVLPCRLSSTGFLSPTNQTSGNLAAPWPLSSIVSCQQRTE